MCGHVHQPVQGTLPGEMHGREYGWQWAQMRGWVIARMTGRASMTTPSTYGPPLPLTLRPATAVFLHGTARNAADDEAQF